MTRLRNITMVKDHEDCNKTYQASYPLTKLDKATQTLLTVTEISIHEEMKQIFLSLLIVPL